MVPDAGLEFARIDQGLLGGGLSRPLAMANVAPAEQCPPRQRRLHHFFEESCDAAPMAVAVELEGERLSYAELDARANRLAHYLISSGVEPGGRVAILLQRSVDTYVALLAVLKAGATFVPIDPASPQDRVQYIAGDSAVRLVLTTAAFAAATGGLACPVLRLDIPRVDQSLAALPATRPPIAGGDDPAAYVIYTSGSSGRPKGVEVAQSSICNFIDVVPGVYDVRPEDRVYQGMTIAFDFSIEEIWPTWAVGAALVAGPTDSRRLGSELAQFLEDTGVTVLYCVPTVLATIDRDLPAIRALMVGGEACPQELVERWSTPRRRILNTYGPTEATVTCIWTELVAGRPVAIGRPLPTYTAYVLDDHLRLLPDGEAGEICVGGPGVARGYVGRPELTAERFVPSPFAEGGRLYRTGDLGRVLPDGEIEYLGRVDSEVKVRGHRVDLQEIESVLREHDAVGDAVVALMPVSTSASELAAYITRRTLDPDDAILTRQLRDLLCERLPQYMVPVHLTILVALPMLPSGKVDRKSLPEPQGARLVCVDGPYVPPATSAEREIAVVWAEALGLQPAELSVEADFFVDLGGHSLAAATVVSAMRGRGLGERLSIGQLYQHPTVRGLAHQVGSLQVAEPNTIVAERRMPRARRRPGLVAACGLAQVSLMYALLAVFCLPVAIVYSINDGVASRTVLLQLMLSIPPMYLVGRWLLPVVGIRVLGMGLKSGSYPLWGATYVRIWFMQKLLSLSPAGLLSGSPLLPPYLRLLGARVGRHAHIASGDIALPTFTEIGEAASVGYGVQIQPYHVEDGWITVRPVVVGQRAFVGASCQLAGGASIGAGASLAEHSAAGRGQVIGPGEHWQGSPSSRLMDRDVALDAMAKGTEAPQKWPPRLLLGFAAGFVALELLPFAMVAPVVALVWWTLLKWGVIAGAATTALSGPVYVATACLLIATSRRLVLPVTPVGIRPLRTGLGLRKWVADKLLEASLMAINPLYSTLYTAPWLRLLGAEVGRGAEVSTVAHLDPDLLVLGEQSFVADMASIGCARYHNGYIELRPTHVGRRAFVGNASFVPAGTRLGAGSLVGVHTVSPAEVPQDSSWLGSPAIFLPRRQESRDFGEAKTFTPGRRIVAERLLFEFFRITLPPSLLGVAMYAGLLGVSNVAAHAGTGLVILTAPTMFLTAALATVVMVAALKWAMVGRYRPRVEPLWSRFVRRSELVTGLYEAAAVPALLQPLTGTPLLGPLLRLFGTSVGQRSWIDTTFLTEFDLVSIGDEAAVGTGASLQTHLFEDRVMKMSVVTIGAQASVGPRSVVLYDAVVGAGSTLDGLSLVMKGEALPPRTEWVGIPAQAAPRWLLLPSGGPAQVPAVPAQPWTASSGSASCSVTSSDRASITATQPA